MAYFYCLSLVGNLIFLDFLQKKFYNIDHKTKGLHYLTTYDVFYFFFLNGPYPASFC